MYGVEKDKVKESRTRIIYTLCAWSSLLHRKRYLTIALALRDEKYTQQYIK